MVLTAAVVAAIFFMITLRVMAIPAITARVIATGREAAGVIGDKSLDDGEKERLLQRASLGMMRAFGSITLRGGLAMAAALVPLLGLQAAGVADMAAVVRALATWQGIALTSLAMTAVCFIRVRS